MCIEKGSVFPWLAQVVAESLEGAIEVAMDSRLNAAGKWFGAGVLKSHFKGGSPAPIDVRRPRPCLLQPNVSPWHVLDARAAARSGVTAASYGVCASAHERRGHAVAAAVHS
jgi:hypothetical protein